MATAMFALIFGLARLALEEELAENAIYIFALAVYWGLIVIVARKRSDLYRVLRIAAIGIILLSLSSFLIGDFSLYYGGPIFSGAWRIVFFAISVAMILLIYLFNRLIAKAEAKEKSSRELPGGKAILPRGQSDSAAGSGRSPDEDKRPEATDAEPA
jgi:hypothetical protein